MTRDEYYANLQATKDYIAHHGIKGQKWGERRFQNPDGTLTQEGKLRYYKTVDKLISKKNKYTRRADFWQSIKDFDDKITPGRTGLSTVRGALTGTALGEAISGQSGKVYLGTAAGALAGFLSAKLEKKINDAFLDRKIAKNEAKANKVKEQLKSLKVDDLDKNPEKIAEAMQIRKENRKAFAKKVAVKVGVIGALTGAGILAGKAIKNKMYLDSLVVGKPNVNPNHDAFQSIRKAAINGKYRKATDKDQASQYVQIIRAQHKSVPRIEVKRATT